MARKLIWDKEVLIQIEKTAAYVEVKWGKPVASKFIKRLRTSAATLVRQPKLGRQSTLFKEIRFLAISPYHWLFYRIRDNYIQIIYLFDTRQDPDNNPFE